MEEDVARLEPRIAKVEADVAYIRARVSNIEIDLRDMRKSMDVKFEAIGGEFKAVRAEIRRNPMRFARNSGRNSAPFVRT